MAEGTDSVVNISLSLDAVQGQYLKVVAENFGVIPKGNQGEGNESWLFVDQRGVE